MTQEEFIKVLDKKDYPYRIKGDKIVVTHGTVEALPTGVVFNNGDDVYLESLETLPSGVEFRNRGDVSLESLKTIPSGVVFKNGEDVFLRSLETLSPGVEFRNRRHVVLPSLIGGRFGEWYGNIKGIDGNRLLNKMVADGLFDRR